jgi:hypothetical protein
MDILTSQSANVALLTAKNCTELLPCDVASGEIARALEGAVVNAWNGSTVVADPGSSVRTQIERGMSTAKVIAPSGGVDITYEGP